jgi:DNA repair exonuclease SbcCD ATPase subunit
MSEGSMLNLQKKGNIFTFDEVTAQGIFTRSFRSASGFQKTIIGFGIFLSENQLNDRSFPFLLDEAISSLSIENRERMLVFLSALPNQCLVITHDQDSLNLKKEIVE